MKPIHAKAFWGAVGQPAMGVSVVTARVLKGQRASSGCRPYMCAPIRPPCWFDRQKDLGTPSVLASLHFAINHLAEGQQAIADAFGGRMEAKGAERFATAVWTTLSSGAPVLAELPARSIARWRTLSSSMAS